MKSNISLVGMPSSGKTTLGKVVADFTGKTFIDTDAKIVEKIKMSIRDYFAIYGEQKFRDVEYNVVEEVSRMENCLISTGGGVILNPKNMENLRSNGCVIFIDRPVKDLLATSDRPLSDTEEKIVKLYNQRIELYRSADATIVNACCSVMDAAQNIIQTAQRLGVKV